MTKAIDSEDEVQDSSDQGRKPNEAHPCDGRARITLMEDRVPSRRYGEKQPESNDGDVPEVMREMTSGRRHHGPSLRSASIFRMAHSLR